MRALLIVVLCASLELLEAVRDAAAFTRYNLTDLQPGDVIKAWGVYREGSTKFSVNILNSPDWNLLHVDFRPTQNIILLNNKRDGSWTAEPPILVKYHQDFYALDKVLEVKIIVGNDNYRVFLNGEAQGTFPQRDALSNAKYVALWANSDGFQWTAVKVPRSTETISIDPTPEQEYHFEREATTGDTITASGIYAKGTDDFVVNLRRSAALHDYDGNLLYLAFRPSVKDNIIVVYMTRHGTDVYSSNWSKPLREAIPLLKNGQAFNVEIRCQETEFHVYVNGNKLPQGVRYYMGNSLRTLKSVSVSGGSDRMQWTGITSTIPLTKWRTITPSQPLTVLTDSNGLRTSLLHVRLPCSGNPRFWIYFFNVQDRRFDRPWVAGFEMSSQTRGRIYCNRRDDWYLGEHTEFEFNEQPLCENDNIELSITKSVTRMVVRNDGRVLLKHRFRGGFDDRCSLPTAKIFVEMARSGKAMYAAVVGRTYEDLRSFHLK